MLVKCGCFGSLENNCYLITDENTNKSALVDCTEYSDKMVDFIGDANLEYILLTHGHFDHIAGVAEIKAKYNSKVVISAQDEPMLSSTKLSLGSFCGVIHDSAQADLIVGDNDSISLGDTTIRVIATPGHTKGGLCFVADNCLFSGDTLFHLSCGRTDFPGGSVDEIMQSLKRLSQLDGNLIVYSGHGERSTLDFERLFNPYMR